MHRRVTMRHMTHVPDVENYANDALERVVDALRDEKEPIYLDFIIEPGRPHAHHQVELLIKSPNYSIVYKEEGPHVFQLIDRACDMAYRKIHEEKKKHVKARKKGKTDSYKGA